MQSRLNNEIVSIEYEIRSLVVSGFCPPTLPTTVASQFSLQPSFCIVPLSTTSVLFATRRLVTFFSCSHFPVDARLECIQLEDAFFQLLAKPFQQLAMLTRRGRIPFLKWMHPRVVCYYPLACKSRIRILQFRLFKRVDEVEGVGTLVKDDLGIFFQSVRFRG